MARHFFRSPKTLAKSTCSMQRSIFIATLLSITASVATATPISINPIQVCDDAGSNCAQVNFNKAFTDKIFAQTGTTLSYGSISQLNSSKFLNPSRAEADDLIDSRTLFGTTGRKFSAYDVWFVNLIDGNPGFRGLAAVGGDGIVISSTAAVDTFAHELGHNFGFGHIDEDAPGTIDVDRFLMASGSVRTIPTSVADIAPDGLQLSRFDPILPEVTVDMIGATPFESNDFFNVEFKPGAATDLGLASLTIDLGPANAFFDTTDSPPGTAGSPFGFGSLNGVLSSDINISGLSDGSSIIKLSFDTGVFTSGDSLSFGLDIDLFSNIDGFGATADELRASIATLEFENGFSTSGDLSSLVFSSVFDPARNIDRLSPLRGDPISLAAVSVPEPSSISLFLFAVFVVTITRYKVGDYVMKC